jgi:uncharacterized protein YutD
MRKVLKIDDQTCHVIHTGRTNHEEISSAGCQFMSVLHGIFFIVGLWGYRPQVLGFRF